MGKAADLKMAACTGMTYLSRAKCGRDTNGRQIASWRGGRVAEGAKARFARVFM